MTYYKLPDDAPEIVKKIHSSTSADMGGRQYNLVPFGLDELITARNYLGKTNMWINLRKEIEREIRIKTEAQTQVKNPSSQSWFIDLWWAVMSLYGKGKMKRSDARTKKLLRDIKPEWVYNCGGGR